jgi:hypothetical protein
VRREADRTRPAFRLVGARRTDCCAGASTVTAGRLLLCGVWDRAGDSNPASNATPPSNVTPKRATAPIPPARRISRKSPQQHVAQREMVLRSACNDHGSKIRSSRPSSADTYGSVNQIPRRLALRVGCLCLIDKVRSLAICSASLVRRYAGRNANACAAI